MKYEPYLIDASIAPGQTSTFEMRERGEASIALDTRGGAALIEFSLSNAQRVEDGTAIWAPAAGLGPDGVVTNTVLIDEIPSSTSHVRVTNQGSEAVRLEIRQ